MRRAIWLAVLTAALATTTRAQEASEPQERLCIAKNETIYTPGEDHVKAPELNRERIGPDDKGRIRPNSRVLLEVTVNSAGDICLARALKAPTREEATAVAEYVADNFRFRPAMRHGKPVAVRLQVRFDFFP
jgi:hypothetical protein